VNGTPFHRFDLMAHDHHIAIRREADCDGDACVISTAAHIAKEWQKYPTIEIWKAAAATSCCCT
jgi:hypothetical protein